MKQILLIARKDLRSYFYSPIAYVILAVFMAVSGWMFAMLFSYYSQTVQNYSALNFGQRPNLSDMFIRPMFGNMNILLVLIVAPAITMRLLAEEKRDHTWELLFTAPLRSIDVVLGKFLAGLGFFAVLFAATLFYPILLALTASPDWGVIFGCYLGMLCLSATYVATGLFWSSRTENQIVAAVLTSSTLLFFWLISWASHRAGPVWSDVLNYLSLIGHYSNFSQGLLDTTDLIFYASFTGFALFLTNLSVEASN